MIQLLIKQLLLIILAHIMLAANERVALIIGADKGLISDRQLRFATTDAKKISEVYKELGDFQPSRCYLLTNPDVK